MAFDHLGERSRWSAHVEKRLSWSMAVLVIGACSLICWAVVVATGAGLLQLLGRL